MSKNTVDDYFSMTRNNRDGALSPYSTNGLYPSLSWGDTPEFAGLTKTKSHTGKIVYKSANMSRSQADTKVYPYHTVHLTVAPPEKLRPLTPEDVLVKTTGKCLDCSSISGAKCIHFAQDNYTHDGILLQSPGGRKDVPLKSILLKKDKKSLIDSKFSNSVGFDTVNLKYSDDLSNYPSSAFSCSDNDDLDDDKLFNNDEMSRGRASGRIPLNRTTSRSPSRSLSPGSKSPNRIQNLDNFTPIQDHSYKNFFTLRYPTQPIITHDACTLTRKHKLFDDMYAGRLKYVQPKMQNRVILCYVSGRKHTWVGIDWACNQLLEDGDTIVIFASIKNPGRSLTRFQRRNSDVAVVSNITENKIRNSPEYAKAATENIMKYALSVVNPDRIVKITVELAVGTTNDVFEDMFDLYQPSLLVTGSKPGKTAPTKAWSTKRLSDKVVSYSPIPTIIVSPINMGLFEKKLFKVMDKRMSQMEKDRHMEDDEILKELDDVGTYSLEDQKAYIKQTGLNDVFIMKELQSAIDELDKHVKSLKKSDSGSTSEEEEEEDVDRKGGEDKEVEDEEVEDESSSIDSRDHRFDNRSSLSRTLSQNMSSDNEDSEENESENDDLSVDSEAPPAYVASPTNTPSFKLKRLELETQVKIYKEISKIKSTPLNEDTFKHFLSVVSDSAHEYGIQLAESAKMGAEESKLVRTLTGAPEQLVKKKSMVSVNTRQEDDFEEKLRKYRQQKRLEKQQPSAKGKPLKVPKVNVESPSPTNSSRSSNFLQKMKSSSSVKSGPASSVNDGIPIDSSPGIDQNLKEDKKGKKKKRKGFFSSLFGK